MVSSKALEVNNGITIVDTNHIEYDPRFYYIYLECNENSSRTISPFNLNSFLSPPLPADCPFNSSSSLNLCLYSYISDCSNPLSLFAGLCSGSLFTSHVLEGISCLRRRIESGLKNLLALFFFSSLPTPKVSLSSHLSEAKNVGRYKPSQVYFIKRTSHIVTLVF